MPNRDRERDATLRPELSDVALSHLYRGELGRSDRWRTRLDTTTNWSLTTTAAVVSYGFSNANTSHLVLLVGMFMVLAFLLLEARRYRYYDLWIRRVRLLEEGYWVPLLRREPLDPDAIKELAAIIARPRIRLSLFRALATRLNRVYGAILLVLLAAWFTKIYAHPGPPRSYAEFAHRAHVGPFSGHLVVGVLLAVSLAMVVVVIAAAFIRPPPGEVRVAPRTRRRVPLWEAFSHAYQVKARG